MTTPFAQPSAGGEKFEPKDFGGALLLIYPKSYNPNEQTQFGPSTSADCDVVVVDRQDPTTGQPVIKRNARLFGNLANSVRDSIGSQVLGRLGQVPTNKGNPAWVLQNYTDADAAAAAPVHTAYTAGQFQPPANVQAQQGPPPGHDPWAGVNAAPAPPQQQAWGQQPPAAPAPAQQQWGAPPGPPAGTAGPQAAPGAPAAAQPDPTVAFLISKGLPEAQVHAMDPGTRASVAATYQ